MQWISVAVLLLIVVMPPPNATAGCKTIIDQEERPDEKEKCNNSRKNSVGIKKINSDVGGGGFIIKE
jgi:hypothetical protein